MLKFFPIISLIMFLVFLFYQLIEKESEIDKIGDFVEFYAGIFLCKFIKVVL